jgi:hypothetical protein
MQVIVVLHLIVISNGDASQKLDKLLVLDLGLAQIEARQILNHFVHHEGQSILPSNFFAKLEDVELGRVEVLKRLGMLLAQGLKRAHIYRLFVRL